MRIEIIPLIAAVLVGLIGLGLLFDAWTPDEIIVKHERRRRRRARAKSGRGRRDRTRRALHGRGVRGPRHLALFRRRGHRRDAFSCSFGAIKNHRYLGAVVSNRGALRRRPHDAGGGEKSVDAAADRRR